MANTAVLKLLEDDTWKEGCLVVAFRKEAKKIRE